MTTVFAYPGRRFGQLVETLLLAILGSCLGIAWSVLGTYLASQWTEPNSSAKFAIKALFLATAFFFHGFFRSFAPRLWTFVLFEVVICTTGLTINNNQDILGLVTRFIYPVLLAIAVIFVANLCIFPEFSSSFLGETTIRTLQDASKTLADAGTYFISCHDHAAVSSDDEAEKGSGQTGKGIALRKRKLNERSKQNSLQSTNHTQIMGDNPVSRHVSMEVLTASKSKLRSSLAKQETAQDETQFELAFSTLPPRDLKNISKGAMKRLVANIIAVIGACESRYALLEENLANTQVNTENTDAEDRVSISPDISNCSPDLTRPLPRESREPRREDSDILGGRDRIDLNLLRPKKEIEFGDIRVFRYLLKQIATPYHNLQKACDAAVNAIVLGLSLCYVSRLLS